MKKLFTSIIAMMLAAMMLFSMTACDDPTGSGDGPTTDQNGNVIVKIMFHVDKNSAEGKAYQKRIDAFNSKYKNVYKASAL